MNFLDIFQESLNLSLHYVVPNPLKGKMDDRVPHNDDDAQEDFIKLVIDSGAKTCLQ